MSLFHCKTKAASADNRGSKEKADVHHNLRYN